MAIQIEGAQIQNGVISFSKLDGADIETTLTGSSSKLARAYAIKSYIDNIAAGIHWKDSVKCATTGNITLSGEQTIDGITTSGSRVLVLAQTDLSQNGIYVSASGAWSRASDMDSSSEFAGAAVFVREGSTYADVGFVCTNDSDPVVGTDDINFTQFTGAATIVAGDGLDKAGSTLSVNVDDSSIEISADALQVKALGITADMLAGGIGNAKLSNSTISGVALGSNLSSLSVVSGSALSMTSYNGSAASSDLAVQVDGSTIEIATNSIQIKDSGVTNAKLAGSITADKIATGGALDSNAGALEVQVDDSTIEIDGVSNNLRVKDSGITNAKLANSTISGVALGSNLSSLSVVSGSALSMTSYNGSAARSDLAVQVDGSTVEISANAIQIKDAGVTNAKLAGSITADKLATGAGLDDNAGALEVQVDDSTLEIDGVSNNLRIKDSGVTNAKLANSTISGVSLGSNLNALSVVSGSALAMTSYNGSAARSDLAVQVDDSTIEISTNALRLKDGGIQTAKLNNGAVSTDKLADDAVTAAKVGFSTFWDVLSPDGSATAFDLSETINDTFAFVVVVRNGLVLKQVISSPSGQDEYAIDLTGGAGGVSRLTFGSAPTNGSDLRCFYMA